MPPGDNDSQYQLFDLTGLGFPAVDFPAVDFPAVDFPAVDFPTPGELAAALTAFQPQDVTDQRLLPVNHAADKEANALHQTAEPSSSTTPTATLAISPLCDMSALHRSDLSPSKRKPDQPQLPSELSASDHEAIASIISSLAQAPDITRQQAIPQPKVNPPSASHRKRKHGPQAKKPMHRANPEVSQPIKAMHYLDLQTASRLTSAEAFLKNITKLNNENPSALPEYRSQNEYMIALQTRYNSLAHQAKKNESLTNGKLLKTRFATLITEGVLNTCSIPPQPGSDDFNKFSSTINQVIYPFGSNVCLDKHKNRAISTIDKFFKDYKITDNSDIYDQYFIAIIVSNLWERAQPLKGDQLHNLRPIELVLLNHYFNPGEKAPEYQSELLAETFKAVTAGPAAHSASSSSVMTPSSSKRSRLNNPQASASSSVSVPATTSSKSTTSRTHQRKNIDKVKKAKSKRRPNTPASAHNPPAAAAAATSDPNQAYRQAMQQNQELRQQMQHMRAQIVQQQHMMAMQQKAAEFILMTSGLDVPPTPPQNTLPLQLTANPMTLFDQPQESADSIDHRRSSCPRADLI